MTNLALSAPLGTVEQLRDFLADRSHGSTDRQHHGLGTALAVLAVSEYASQYSVGQLGRVLDATYFESSRPSAGQAFSRGLGEALFELRRARDVAAAVDVLLARATTELANPDP